MSDKSPKDKLLDELGLPRLGFSRRAALTPDEGKDHDVVWNVSSLSEVIQEAHRRETAPPRKPKKPS
jgi:hypothetical protein